MSWFGDVVDRLRGRPRPLQLSSAPPAPPTSAEILDSVRADNLPTETTSPLDSVHAEDYDPGGPSDGGASMGSFEGRGGNLSFSGDARTIEDMAPRLDRFGVGSRQAHTVVATATSYLPEAVGGYLRLPREFADRRVVSHGKTSLMVLCDQLDLLGVTLDRISDAVSREDAQALVAHGQFLAEKFGESALAITPDLGPGAVRGEGL